MTRTAIASKKPLSEPNSRQITPDLPSSEDFKAFERHRCRTDLKYLCTEILGFKDWDVCHDELEVWLKHHGRAPRQLILVPREHLKTSIVTVAQTIQAILKNPNITILISNLVLSNAEKIVGQIKDYLRSPKLVALFGDFVGAPWNQDEITVKQRTEVDKTPTISIGSPDKVSTSQHYDKIFLDDILDDTVLGTSDQILKTRNYYSKTIDLLKRPHGELTVVGTRWDDKDLYGSIKSEMKDEYVIYEKGATYDGTIDGKLIFPKKFSNDILKKLLKEKGSYSFWCQYFNQPINRQDQHFKPPVRRWVTLPQDGFDMITLDLAGEEQNADFNVITTTRFSKANQLYVKKYRRGHYTITQMIDFLFDDVAEAKNLQVVGIESVAYQRVFIHLLNLEMTKRNIFFYVKPIIPHRDKFTRILGLQPLWEQGNLLLKPGMIELEEEFDRFPRGMNDDILDTLAMSQHLLEGTAPALPAKVEAYEHLKDDLSRREWESVTKNVFNRKSSSVIEDALRVGE